MELAPGIFVSDDAAGPSSLSEGLWNGISDDDLLKHVTLLEENGCVDEGVHNDSRQLKIVQQTPVGDCFSYIKTPPDIQSKKAVINPQNLDQQCFKWAILVKYLTEGHKKHRVNKNYFALENMYDFTGLTFPTPLHEVVVFEKNNPTTSVNVYGLRRQNDKKHIVYPLKVVREEKENHHDLLLLKNENKSHYTYISNFSRLVRAQLTKHKGHLLICKNCFSYFDDQPKKFKLHGQAALDRHKLSCRAHEPISAQMPSAGSMSEFNG